MIKDNKENFTDINTDILKPDIYLVYSNNSDKQLSELITIFEIILKFQDKIKKKFCGL